MWFKRLFSAILRGILSVIHVEFDVDKLRFRLNIGGQKDRIDPDPTDENTPD